MTSVRRVAVGALGGILTVTGIALLVLPGPGFVLVAAGLAVLATQFVWAERPLAYAKDKARVGMNEVAHSTLRAGMAVVAAVGLLAVGVCEIAGVVDVPLMNGLTAGMLLLSGLALIATVVYARRSGRRTVPEDAGPDR